MMAHGVPAPFFERGFIVFKFYLKYIGSPFDLEDIVDLKDRGLSNEEVEGYLEFFQYEENLEKNDEYISGK